MRLFMHGIEFVFRAATIGRAVLLAAVLMATMPVHAQPGDPCSPNSDPYGGSFEDFLDDLLDDPADNNDPDGPGRFEPHDGMGGPAVDCGDVYAALSDYLNAVCEGAGRHDVAVPLVPPGTSYSCTCDPDGSEHDQALWTPERLSQTVCAFMNRYGSSSAAGSACMTDCDALITAVTGCVGPLTTDQEAKIRECMGCTDAGGTNCSTAMSVPDCGSADCAALQADVDNYSRCMQEENGRAPTEDELVDRICAFLTACSLTSPCSFDAECFTSILGLSPEVAGRIAECMPPLGMITENCEKCDGPNGHAVVSGCDANGDGVSNCDDLVYLALESIACQDSELEEPINWCALVTAWVNACKDDDGCSGCTQTLPCIGYLIEMGVPPEAFEGCAVIENECPCSTVSCLCFDAPSGCVCKIPGGGCEIPCDINGDGTYDCEDVSLLVQSLQSCATEEDPFCVECAVIAVCKQMNCNDARSGDKGRMCNNLAGCLELALGQPGVITNNASLLSQLQCACGNNSVAPISSCGDLATTCDIAMESCGTCDGTAGGGGLTDSFALPNGRPTNLSTDLTVELPGADLPIVRSYYGSNCRETSIEPMQPAGENWMVSTMMYAEEIPPPSMVGPGPFDPSIKIYGPTAQTVRTYTFVAASGSLTPF